MAMVVVMSLVSGCKDGGPTTRIFVKNAASGHRLRIAVLPFDNVSKDQDAGRVLTNTVITYLLSTGNFDVVEPGVVSSTMTNEGIRLTDGVTVETCSKLQDKLKADAFITGLVEDYGEVRIGNDSYPSLSFSARLVDAKTAEILWAATISKTGADNVKLFDIGRVSSLGKLSKQAVAAMAVSLAKSSGTIFGDMLTPGDKSGNPEIHTISNKADSKNTTTSTDAANGNTLAQTAKYLDESASNGEQELRALLKDVGDAKLGGINYTKHYHDTIETKYTLANGKTVELKLVDYRQKAAAEKYVKLYNNEFQPTTFETLPAYSGESQFGFYHLDVAVGRFGLFFRGPKASETDIQTLGKGVITLLR